MSTRYTPVPEDRKDEPGVQEATTHIMGQDITTYVLVERVDDVDQETTDDVQNVVFAVPRWVEPTEPEHEDDVARPGYWVPERRELDLGKKNRDAFLKALSKYTEASRLVVGEVLDAKATAGSKSGLKNPAYTAKSREIRAWGLEKQAEGMAALRGINIPEKGRVPADLRKVYYELHPNEEEPPETL